MTPSIPAEGERRYGEWSGRPQGVREDKARCIETIYDRGFARGMIGQQCSRKRGKGADGLYCTIHARRHPAPIEAQS